MFVTSWKSFSISWRIYTPNQPVSFIIFVYYLCAKFYFFSRFLSRGIDCVQFWKYIDCLVYNQQFVYFPYFFMVLLFLYSSLFKIFLTFFEEVRMWHISDIIIIFGNFSRKTDDRQFFNDFNIVVFYGWFEEIEFEIDEIISLQKFKKKEL